MDVLPHAEFEANCTRTTSTRLSPFQATRGRNPRTGLEPPNPATDSDLQGLPLPVKKQIQLADETVDRLDRLKAFLKQNLAWAQQKQKDYADRRRLPAPEIKEGALVWLDSQFLRSNTPSKSLDFKNRGTFKVKKVHNTAYELELPPEMDKIFPVFHLWLLHIDRGKPIEGQDQYEPGPTRVVQDKYGAEQQEIEVAAILDSKYVPTEEDPLQDGDRGLLMYKVLWEGYPNEPTWEPYSNLVGAEERLLDFHSKRTRKPGPHGRLMELEGAKEIAVKEPRHARAKRRRHHGS